MSIPSKNQIPIKENGNEQSPISPDSFSSGIATLRAESVSEKNDFETENVEQLEKTKVEEVPKEITDTANKYFLIKILSPEIGSNEERKRQHKDILIKLVKTFLLFQFIIAAILFIGIIAAVLYFHSVHNDFELSVLDKMMKFISFYITSVVVELIAMLNYIVTQVFDTSITGLVEIYKDAILNEEEKEKKKQEEIGQVNGK